MLRGAHGSQSDIREFRELRGKNGSRRLWTERQRVDSSDARPRRVAGAFGCCAARTVLNPISESSASCEGRMEAEDCGPSVKGSTALTRARDVSQALSDAARRARFST